MKIIEHVAIKLMIGVVCDNGIMQGEHGYEGMYSEQDKNDLVLALENLETDFGLFDFMSKDFSHFEAVEQFDQLIDWIVAPEQTNWEEFEKIYPEYKIINEILSRPF